MRSFVVVLLVVGALGCPTAPVEVDAGSPGRDAGSAVDSGVVNDAGAMDASVSSDAGIVDGGSIDGGSTDGGSLDGGPLDGGSLDGGSLDGGSLDAGTIDAGSVDGGSIDAGTIDAGATGISLQEFCTRVIDEACTYKLRCGYFSDAGLDACRRSEHLEFDAFCKRADAGTATYSPRNGLACLERMPTAKCWAGPPCGVFGGLMAEDIFTNPSNPPCGTVTCGAGTFCDRDCASPMCVPFAGIGSACSLYETDNRRCDQSTSFCGDELDGGGLCRARRTIGQTCMANDCVPGSLCFYNPATPGIATCIAPIANGAPCPSPSYSAYCASGWCAPTGQCASRDAGVPPCRSASDCGSGVQAVCRGLVLSSDGGVITTGVCGTASPLGGACSMDWGRGSCDTLSGHACLDGVCKRLVPNSLDAGDECIRPPFGVQAPYFGYAACKQGTSCQADPTAHPTWGRCKPSLPIGAPCATQFHSCTDGLACDVGPDGGSICLQLGRLGQQCPCFADFRCAAVDGGRACLPLLPADAGCSTTAECAPSLRCAAGSCGSPLPTGATCSLDGDCADGLCRFSRCVAMCLSP